MLRVVGEQARLYTQIEARIRKMPTSNQIEQTCINIALDIMVGLERLENIAKMTPIAKDLDEGRCTLRVDGITTDKSL